MDVEPTTIQELVKWRVAKMSQGELKDLAWEFWTDHYSNDGGRDDIETDHAEMQTANARECVGSKYCNECLAEYSIDVDVQECPVCKVEG